MSGPSGAGKGTVVAAVLARHPEVWLSVSATTRAPRPGEREGAHYFFVDDAAFDALIAEDGLLEWAEFSGHRYGTPRRGVEERLAVGTPVLLEIELQGARQVRHAMPDALLVFLVAPSAEELRRRLTDRGTEDAEAVERRMARAAEELAAADEFDAVVVNHDVQVSADRLVALMGLGPVGPGPHPN